MKSADGPQINVHTIGLENNPVVIIDNVHPDPDRVRDYARTLDYSPVKGGFPGYRAAIDAAYMSPFMPLLRSVLEDVFGLHKGVTIRECKASIVCTPPSALTPPQSRPHIDAADTGLIAMMHYLDEPWKGGTGFYRHKPTGFETITADRAANYEAALSEMTNVEPGYLTETNAQFEKIFSVDAAFNRLAVYRGCQLHSGDIHPDNVFQPDPNKARLSINMFLDSR